MVALLLLLLLLPKKAVLLKFDPSRNSRINMCETAAAAAILLCVCKWERERAVIKKSLLYCIHVTRPKGIPFNSSHFGHIKIMCMNLFSVTILHCLCVILNKFKEWNDKCYMNEWMNEYVLLLKRYLTRIEAQTQRMHNEMK